MLNSLRKSSVRRALAQRLQEQLVVRARAPVFFQDFQVADNFDGRFDLMAFHAWLVLERLRAAGMKEAAQTLTDVIFVGFDEALREQGAGDMSMGRRMKAIADAFYGRLHAYSGAADLDALSQALARNLYRARPGSEGPARALALYGLSARAALAACAIGEGDLDFGPLPAP